MKKECDPVFFTVSDLCEHLQISESHVRSLIFKNQIPYTKVGALIRFEKVQIDRWIKEKTIMEEGVWNN